MTLKGPQLSWSILNGFKLIENRSRSLGLKEGWYGLHTGKGSIEQGNRQKLISEITSLPDVESGLVFGSLVGAFHVLEQRVNTQCGSSIWVDGPVCYVIDATIAIDEPIACPGRLGAWKLDPSIRRKLVSQLSKAKLRWNDMSKVHT